MKVVEVTLVTTMAEIKKKSEFKNIIIENRQARHEYFVDDTIEWLYVIFVELMLFCFHL